VIVRFQLYKNGKLVPGSLRATYSNNPEVEKGAIKSVLDASRYFLPLPEGAAEKVDVEFKFTKTGVSGR
jgi:hypothetical protein